MYVYINSFFIFFSFLFTIESTGYTCLIESYLQQSDYHQEREAIDFFYKYPLKLQFGKNKNKLIKEIYMEYLIKEDIKSRKCCQLI